jgi:cysteinyl-tRNA synthetase
MIKFMNTLGGKLETFEPLREGRVGLYTCGPTVYNFLHVGNYRAYVFEDLLKRFLLRSGYRVTHVLNLTDVDDKTIQGARRQGLSLNEFTRPFIEAFFEDARTLRILPADFYPRATEHIPDMVAIIKGLLAKGYAYVKDGSVYFSIARFSGYGSLSRIRMDELKPGLRSEADEYEKENVHDFALWKAPKEDEPSWETDIGRGRPGWHIECSAMSSKYLGWTFDVHCGGVDNIFPHHENEIAQSEAYSGQKFVRTWMHCHHLIVDGEKMSKSKGNQFTLRDLMDKGVDPIDLRFLLLSTHYRKVLNYTSDALAQAAASRKRLLDFLFELRHVMRPGEMSPATEPLIRNTEERFMSGLSDDLNISESLAALFALVKSVNVLMAEDKITTLDAGALISFVRSIDEVLAVLHDGPDLEVKSADRVFPQESVAAATGRNPFEGLGPEMVSKIEAREKARKDKDFRLADRLRGELLQEGIVLEDAKDGIRWKKVRPTGTGT